MSSWVKSWNGKAQELIKQLISQPAGPGGGPGPSPIPVPTPTPPPASATLCQARLNPSDANSVSDFLASVRSALSKLTGGSVRVKLVREEDDE